MALLSVTLSLVIPLRSLSAVKNLLGFSSEGPYSQKFPNL